MMTRRSFVVLAIGAACVLASSLLPIQPDQVQRNTAQSLIRKALSDVVPDEAARQDVRLVYTGDEALHDIVARTVDRHVGLKIADDAGLPPVLVDLSSREGRLHVSISVDGGPASHTEARLGDWLSLAPPLVAVILALAFRQVIAALLIAVWAGVWVTAGTPHVAALETVTGVLIPVITDSFNLQILGFTFALVGMIAVVNRMGGTRALIDAMSRYAKTPRDTQIATALMGTAIFFDDYANTVVVGSTARQLTDAQRISREKLAYIVDSTSAPIAGIALVSTWIGYEVGLFNSLLPELESVAGLPSEGYGLFFEALPLRFYCFFALALVFLSAWMRRDMGPMLQAERRTRAGGPPVPGEEVATVEESLEKPGVPRRWFNAIIPIGLVLVFTFGSIVYLGRSNLEGTFNPFSLGNWRLVFEGASDDIGSILFNASIAGSVAALGLAVGQRLLGLGEALSVYMQGIRHLAGAAAILILAWSIKVVCEDVGTGMAIVALIGDHLPPLALPLVVFGLSGCVAFFTGTSWGAMALILPVAAPLAVAISGEAFIVVACIGAVLDGAIWGDHCSPISDTTVLSSTACGCPHMEHVRTQLPYALLAMGVSAVFGYLAYGAGLPVWLSYVTGIAALAAGLLVFGRDPNKPATSP